MLFHFFHSKDLPKLVILHIFGCNKKLLFFSGGIWKIISSYLEDHFNGKDSGEDVVEVGQDVVALALLLDRVLGGEGDAAQDNDDHDERVEAGQRDDSMNKNPDPSKKLVKSQKKLS